MCIYDDLGIGIPIFVGCLKILDFLQNLYIIYIYVCAIFRLVEI